MSILPFLYPTSLLSRAISEVRRRPLRSLPTISASATSVQTFHPTNGAAAPPSRLHNTTGTNSHTRNKKIPLTLTLRVSTTASVNGLSSHSCTNASVIAAAAGGGAGECRGAVIVVIVTELFGVWAFVASGVYSL
ncbi:hypothetical protein ACH5RR_006224 [Cinchona calisaya]|uniref:Uncharacterized protein n=1 Tax=Cinchona calisaya TaxID=153742 RepID=A0ABD3ANE0_9GENT